MKIYLYVRPNGYLYLQYFINGKRFDRSTKLKDTKQNRLFVNRDIIPMLKIEISSKESLNDSSPRHFSYYSEIYQNDKKYLKTFPQIVNRLKLINDIFGDMLITSITRNDIKSFVRNRLLINASPTIKGYLTQIKGVFDIAIDCEHIRDNPIHNIDLPLHFKDEIEPFSVDEVIKLLNHAVHNIYYYNDMYDYLVIAFFTGLRTGEILALTKNDIDFDKKVLSVSKSYSKGNFGTPKTLSSVRSVPLSNEFFNYFMFFGVDRLFEFNTFNGNLQKKWRLLLIECNIKYRKPYSTRHTYIVNMIKKSGLSVIEIAQLVGHTNTQMIIQNYVKYIKDEHLKVSRDINLYS